MNLLLLLPILRGEKQALLGVCLYEPFSAFYPQFSNSPPATLTPPPRLFEIRDLNSIAISQLVFNLKLPKQGKTHFYLSYRLPFRRSQYIKACDHL